MEANKKKAIILQLASTLVFSFMSVCNKFAGSVSPMERLFFRNLFMIIILIGMSIYKKTKIIIKKEDLGLLTIRSLCAGLSVLSGMYTVTKMYLSDQNIISNLGPFVTLVVAHFVLKEEITKPQIGFMAMAFAGIAIVAKPSADMLSNPAVLIALAGAFVSGCSSVPLRMLSAKGAQADGTVFFFAVFCLLMSLPSTLMHFVMPTPMEMLACFGIGLFACGGQVLMTMAYEYASPTELAVYGYTTIIFTAINGYIFFGQVASLSNYIGYAIVMAASLMMFFYNKKRAQQLAAARREESLNLDD